VRDSPREGHSVIVQKASVLQDDEHADWQMQLWSVCASLAVVG
jgi:hypothetical protein